MPDPFPSRPVVAKVQSYIPLSTPPPAHNPPPYTRHTPHHNEESATGDPFLAPKPPPFSYTPTGNPFTRRERPIPLAQQPHYIQNSADVHERQQRESWCMNRFLVGLSLVLLLLTIVAVVVKGSRSNS
ncbi:hypothetical protein BKA61DRAFT_683926 [Leptodontidium sp. MPI-SDFR-AT-0119]|nr:hypothetical protein BKA61DRAFT_683926 [Leptodontidium sp. MPI-SDFR-AT-0119]